MPVLRHYSQAYKFYGAVPGAQLIVRMISTVYNYDYIQDLVLGIDGTIDVKVTTSGYIQATAFRSFYPQHYGFPVFTNVTGAWQRWAGNLSVTVEGMLQATPMSLQWSCC
jgi:Cu2+-containing amine oxidase